MLFFREPFTYYKPEFGGQLTIFIFNLLWWVLLANFGVALVNMLPLGVFDGGRVFYSTVLWITGSKNKADKAYRFMTYLILGIFVAIMVLWGIYFF
jgi:membrane-associated protease RseP (regulator of RpoE activity)